jgi:hypothetical protein
MPSSPDLLTVALAVAAALERCGVRYSIGGSLASAFTGEPRSTLDVDILVELPPSRIDEFVSALGDQFFADPIAIARAVGERSSVNIFHNPTSIKVDLFVAGDSVLERCQLARRSRVRLTAGDLYVHSAEDILLQKLHWFRLGGEVSDRQWRDIVGIVAVQGDRLDRNFLQATAHAVGLQALLHRAFSDAGAAPGS